MKKWLYFIVPFVMLLVFTFFYLAHSKEAEIKERARKEQIAVEKQKEEERKAMIEEQARQDAAKRSAEREAEAAAKEAERIAKWEAEGREIQETTDGYNAEADKLSREISALEIQLDNLHKAKEALNGEVLALSKQVEQGRIDKRNAELEIQRKTENVIMRAEKSGMAQMPVALPETRR